MLNIKFLFQVYCSSYSSRLIFLVDVSNLLSAFKFEQHIYISFCTFRLWAQNVLLINNISNLELHFHLYCQHFEFLLDKSTSFLIVKLHLWCFDMTFCHYCQNSNSFPHSLTFSIEKRKCFPSFDPNPSPYSPGYCLPDTLLYICCQELKKTCDQRLFMALLFSLYLYYLYVFYMFTLSCSTCSLGNANMLRYNRIICVYIYILVAYYTCNTTAHKWEFSVYSQRV